MALQFLDDGGYSGGVNRDDPSWMLKKGEVYDSSNMVYDKPGIARQRGGTAALSALGVVAGNGHSLGFVRQDDNAARLELFSMVNGTGDLWWINQTTGAATNLNGFSNSGVFQRAVQHFGFLLFPGIQNAAFLDIVSAITAGPITAPALTVSSTVGVATTANNRVITLTAPDSTANMRVGMTVKLATTPVVAGQYNYYGRITEIISGTTFGVWPVPTKTVAYTGAGCLLVAIMSSMRNAFCGASFQNRLLLGGPAINSQSYDRRFVYSLLPTEELANPTGSGDILTGASFIENTKGYFPNNFIDVPGTDPFVGMEAVNDNELLILSSRRPVVFRGNLITQTATTSQQVTFDITEIDKNASCAHDHSIQRTPRGIMWAGTDGVFIYTGGDAVNVLDGKMATYWRTLARSTTFAIHGSAYIRGHYLVAATSGGTAFQLLVNLSNREYTFAPLTGLDIFAAVPNPTTPSQVWALRWSNPSGAIGNFTNGQVIRIESILDTYTAGATKTDSDGSVVPFSITTRVLAGDTTTQKIQARATIRYQSSMTTTAVTLTAQSRIDAADITAVAVRALGSLSNTATLVVTAATNATPIVCTTAVHGLQTDDFVDINGGLVNTHVNGRWRITVLSTTTFALLGSSGNGAYTASSGSAKKVTEDDFMTNTLDQGQGVSFVIASSGTVNNFELHGLRVAFYEQRPVMSA